MGFGRKALLFGSALALGVAVSAADQAEAERLRKARRPSGEQIAWLVIFALVGILISGALVKAGGGPLVLLPIVAWAYSLRGIRNSNERRAKQSIAKPKAPSATPRPKPTPANKPKPAIRKQEAAPTRKPPSQDEKAIPRHEIERRLREQERRESVARKNAERRQRAQDLGTEGSALYARAESAVRRILSTELARSGALGNLHESDFGSDLKMIEDNSRAATELQRLIRELSGIPSPTAEDRARVEEATHKIADLNRQSRERVEMLENGWEEAKAVDASIREEREQAALAEKRDEVHGRLAAALFGAEAALERPPSSAAERVLVLGAAYREVKGLNVIDSSVDGSSAAPSSPSLETVDSLASKLNPFRWLRVRNGQREFDG